jgi:uncharacterized protein (DUF2235 family)
MSKNIVICLDGTGNQLKAKGNTNVVQLYSMLDLSDPEKQVAYYDPGVGTFSAPGAWSPPARFLSRVFGLAFGSGMRANLGEAYTYLIQNYERGDRLYVFGFSRGAYTARALAGLIRTVGIFRPGTENLVEYAVTSYVKREKSDADWNQLHEFARIFAHHVDGRTSIPITYLGIWDTVKAAGILRWDAKFPYTHHLSNVTRVRHAVSIDEKRRPYREYLALVHDKAAPPPVVEEVWFAGVHSDVGGTFEDDPKLAKVSLKWMVEGAMQAGILLRPKTYQKVCDVVTGANATGTVHAMGKIWGVLTYRKRPVPKGANVHTSVQERIATQPAYGKKIPADAVWSDPTWTAARPETVDLIPGTDRAEPGQVPRAR